MNIIYILTTVLMFILKTLLYKKEEKQNFLKSISINIIIYLSYNIFISVIMSFIGISSTLVNLSIINAIISFSIAYKIYKDKKIQKYSIEKLDIIALIIILFIVLIVVVNQYGIPINLKSSVTDATVHYFAANEFEHTSKLLFNENSDILNLWNLHFLQPGAYINTGIILKIFSGIISETYFCQIYFIFDISIWFLSGILMYALLSRNQKENKNKILPLIFSLIYMLGYPLNSLLSGFSYLSIGMNIIIAILIVSKENINKYYKLILLFLLNFGLMFTYYFFAPVVYLAEFLQIIIKIKKNKQKIISLENVIEIFFTVILPGIFGILYFIVFQLIKFGKNPITQYSAIFAMKGDIYHGLIIDMLLFLLLSIYYIIYSLKNKKYDIENKMLILSIVFSFILFIGMSLQKVSEYYNYKSYYMLWIFIIVVGFNAIEVMMQKNKKIIISICSVLYLIGILSSMLLNQKLFIFDIYRENGYQIKENNQIITVKELDVLDYYNKNINVSKKDDETYMCYNWKNISGRSIWIYAITKNPYNFIDIEYGELTSNLEQYIEGEKKYAVIFKKEYYGDFDKIDTYIEENNLKILFRNEAGIVLEKN